MPRRHFARVILLVAAVLPASVSALEVALRRGEATPAQIVGGALDAEFAPLPGAHFVPRAGEAHAWLRLSIPAGAQGQHLLVARNPIAGLALHRRGETTPRWQGGFYAPMDDAGLTAFAWTIERAPDVLYLRVDDADPSQVRVRLVESRVHEHEERRFVALLAAVLAVLGTMALTNAVFHLAFRDPAYAHYVGYVLAVVGFIAWSHGLPYDLPGLRWTAALGSGLNVAVGALSGLLGTTFFRAFLATRRHTPRADALLRLFVVVFSVLAIAALTTPAPRLTYVRNGTNYGLLMLSAVQFAVAGFLAWRGSRTARFFLLAWTAPIAATAMRALGAAGAIRTTPAIVDAYLLGQAAQALILSIGLADRSVQLRRERDLALGQKRRIESRLVEERTRRSEAELRASTDALTGVRNRGGIERELATAFAAARDRGGTLSVLFVDLDHFKPVNDTHGHSAGDLCLVLLARRIQQGLRDADHCGRYGGDEFLVLLPDADASEARSIAERIRQRVMDEPVRVGEAALALSVSIGVATLDPSDSDASALLARADAAVYRAKSAGRGRVAH